MEKKHFQIEINAPRERVWSTLWDDKTYREWTSVFSEGSRAETDWQKGSKVLFLDGKGDGMVSTIADNKPNEYMSIKHLGMFIDGKEDYDHPTYKEWAGAMENYTLRGEDGKTEVIVDIDITADHAEYFEKTWPVALQKLKEISEKAGGE